MQVGVKWPLVIFCTASPFSNIMGVFCVFPDKQVGSKDDTGCSCTCLSRTASRKRASVYGRGGICIYNLQPVLQTCSGLLKQKKKATDEFVDYIILSLGLSSICCFACKGYLLIAICYFSRKFSYLLIVSQIKK